MLRLYLVQSVIVLPDCLLGMSEHQNPISDLKSEKRNALLAALARAQGDNVPAALLSGNMEKIESWVGSLDRLHATRLLRWLIKENS